MDRIEKLEFLDEGGLLTQLLRHYCISVGYNDKSSIGQLPFIVCVCVVCVCLCEVGLGNLSHYLDLTDHG